MSTNMLGLNAGVNLSYLDYELGLTWISLKPLIKRNLSSALGHAVFFCLFAPTPPPYTLILGYKGNEESAKLVLALILPEFLTSFDP